MLESWLEGREVRKGGMRQPPREYPIMEKLEPGESQGRGEDRRT